LFFDKEENLVKTQRVIWVAALTVCGVAMGGALTGKVTAGKGNSVVYVEAFAGAAVSVPAKHFVMDQKGLSFQPHILVVPVGATVDFLNSDKVQHNIFWPSISGDKKQTHNMGTWPTGEVRPFKYDKPGVVPLLCNVHPEMGGYVIVVPTQYSAQTDASGAYKIDGLPPGQYTVTAWHEGMKTQSKPVTISGDSTLDFALSK
jgi:plastocyanin